MTKRKGPLPIPVELRFWKHVRKTRGCWKWIGATSGFGYGVIGSGGERNKNVLAHRVSWEINFGLIPLGKKVLHKCDNPSCTRPDHLFLGTIKDNAQDMANKGRSTHGEKHHNAKLTIEQVKEIRRLSKTNMLQAEIAKQVGTSRKNVSQIARGKRWKRIEEPVVFRHKGKTSY